MIHITPLHDAKEHQEDSTCDCFPHIIKEEGELICIHQAFDARELIEEGFEPGRKTGVKARCGRELNEGDLVESVQGTRFLVLTILGMPVIMLPDKKVYDLNSAMTPNLFWIGNVVDDLKLRASFFYNLK